MKKLLASSLVTLGLFFALPAVTSATPAKTDVTGTISNNGSPVDGAKVVVVCDNHSRHTTTNASGSYLVQYPANQCPAGATVYVTATKNRMGGTNTGKSNGVTTDLNVALVNVSLPEFGTITGLAAAGLGGGAIVAVRRRKLDRSVK